jgi:antitoxin component YwqK of YwqJK toxin-antitoxin module
MTRKILLLPLILFFFPVVYGEKTYLMTELVERGGFYYKKFTDDVFTGTVMSKYDQGRIQNGLKVNYWIRYYKNGQLRDKGSWIKGWKDDEWVYHFTNGQLKSKGTYWYGEKDGPWISYHDNGQLLSKGTYKDDKLDGPWVFYHDNGQVWYEGTYKDGEKVDD